MEKVEKNAGWRVPAAWAFWGILAAVFDLAVTLLYAYAGVILGFGFWPALAVAGVTYNIVATLFSSRGFGLLVSEWVIRVVAALPVARRRLVSSRAGHA